MHAEKLTDFSVRVVLCRCIEFANWSLDTLEIGFIWDIVEDGCHIIVARVGERVGPGVAFAAKALCSCTRLGKLGAALPGQALGQVEDTILILSVLGEGFGDDLSKQTKVLWLSHGINLAEGRPLSGEGACNRSGILEFMLWVTKGIFWCLAERGHKWRLHHFYWAQMSDIHESAIGSGVCKAQMASDKVVWRMIEVMDTLTWCLPHRHPKQRRRRRQGRRSSISFLVKF